MQGLRLLALAGLFSAMTATALAQDERQSALELMRLAGSREMAMQFIDAFLPRQIEFVGKANPDLDEAFLQRLGSEIRAEAAASLDDFAEAGATIYMRHFTSAEIDALIAFYRSPLGQKVIETTPAIMQASMAAGGEWSKAVLVRVMERIKLPAD
jgi:uncharacterized protein